MSPALPTQMGAGKSLSQNSRTSFPGRFVEDAWSGDSGGLSLS